MKSNGQNDLTKRIVNASGGRLSAADINGIKQGDLRSVSGLLSEDEQKLLLKALKDRTIAKKILSDPKVRDILGGKKP